MLFVKIFYLFMYIPVCMFESVCVNRCVYMYISAGLYINVYVGIHVNMYLNEHVKPLLIETSVFLTQFKSIWGGSTNATLLVSFNVGCPSKYRLRICL